MKYHSIIKNKVIIPGVPKTQAIKIKLLVGYSFLGNLNSQRESI